MIIWLLFVFYRVFVDQCFRPFSATLLDDGVYKTLCKETNCYVQAVNNAVDKLVISSVEFIFITTDRHKHQVVLLFSTLPLC